MSASSHSSIGVSQFPPSMFISSMNLVMSSPPSRAYPGDGAASPISTSVQQGVNELLRIEGCQVVGSLAEPDELDRYAELPLDRDHDAALRRTVQLGQDQAGDVDDLGEHAGLGQAVLAGGGVDDEQHLVDVGGLLDHPLDLAELVHQAGLGVQPAGGVDQYGVRLPLDALLDRVERDGGRVATLGPADGPYADALAPGLQLVRGRGAERVRGAQYDVLVLGDQ